MKLSELIQKLEALKAEHGDLEVVVQTLTHVWPPEPEVRRNPTTDTHRVLLNP